MLDCLSTEVVLVVDCLSAEGMLVDQLPAEVGLRIDLAGFVLLSAVVVAVVTARENVFSSRSGLREESDAALDVRYSEELLEDA